MIGGFCFLKSRRHSGEARISVFLILAATMRHDENTKRYQDKLANILEPLLPPKPERAQ
jgi:hypothetical protein